MTNAYRSCQTTDGATPALLLVENPANWLYEAVCYYAECIRALHLAVIKKQAEKHGMGKDL